MKHLRWLLLALLAAFAVPHAAHAQAGVLLYCQNGVKQPGQGLPSVPASLATPCPALPMLTNGSGVTIPNLAGTQAFFSYGNTSGTIMPGVAGKRFFLTALLCNINPGTVATTAGVYPLNVLDGSNTVIGTNVYFATTAPTVTTVYNAVVNFSGMAYISGAPGNALAFQWGSGASLSQATTCTAIGGYTASATP